MAEISIATHGPFSKKCTNNGKETKKFNVGISSPKCIT